MDLGTIDRAGISQREFAALAGMTRVTVNRWIVGERKPQEATRKKAEDTLKRLEVLINEGHLPLPRKHTSANLRMAALRRLFTPPAA